MSMQEKMRAIGMMLVDFYGNNEIHVHQESTETKRDSFQELELTTGLQADIIANHLDPVIENVGHPREVFVHAGSLSRLMGCSVQTARNHLEDIESAGLAKLHGDIHADVGNVKLYRPTIGNPSDYANEINSFIDHPSASERDDLIEVTPSDFHHIGNGRWRYDRNPNVVIDAKQTEGKSNRQYLQDQLEQHELTASSLKNFQYQLRKRAGLT